MGPLPGPVPPALPQGSSPWLQEGPQPVGTKVSRGIPAPLLKSMALSHVGCSQASAPPRNTSWRSLPPHHLRCLFAPPEPRLSHPPPIVSTAPGLAQPIHIEASSSHVTEGQTLDLNCVVPGQAHTQVTWYKRGGSLPARHQVRVPWMGRNPERARSDLWLPSASPTFSVQTPACLGTPGDQILLHKELSPAGESRDLGSSPGSAAESSPEPVSPSTKGDMWDL